ncbi:MAG: hypothetical protein U0704_10405 [Candidatus Eisenbacteria bacterium]
MSLRIPRFLAAVAFTLLVAAPVAHAQVVFEDQFDGTAVDYSKWTGGPGNGLLDESGGTLKMYGAGCGVFPALFSKGVTFPINAQPFRFTMRHRYLGTGPSGNGMNWFNSAGGYVLEMWQDSIHPQYVSLYQNSAWTGIYTTGGTDLAWHDYVIDYCGGTFTVTIDGQLRHSVAGCNVASLLAIGHPPGFSSCTWTTQEYDYIRIEKLNSCGTPNLNCTTPAAPTTWGRLKAMYR